MALTSVTLKNYRSVANISFPVHKLTVFVGKNGVGKTNLYQAMRLLHCAAIGTITREIAQEGGLACVMWAGPRKRHDTSRLILEVELEQLVYTVEIGFPRPTDAALENEPMVKEERLTLRTDSPAPSPSCTAKGPLSWCVAPAGAWNNIYLIAAIRNRPFQHQGPQGSARNRSGLPAS